VANERKNDDEAVEELNIKSSEARGDNAGLDERLEANTVHINGYLLGALRIIANDFDPRAKASCTRKHTLARSMQHTADGLGRRWKWIKPLPLRLYQPSKKCLGPEISFWQQLHKGTEFVIRDWNEMFLRRISAG
jgi:hypothetical protein